VQTQSWSGKSAVFLMESALTSHGSSKSYGTKWLWCKINMVRNGKLWYEMVMVQIHMVRNDFWLWYEIAILWYENHMWYGSRYTMTNSYHIEIENHYDQFVHIFIMVKIVSPVVDTWMFWNVWIEFNSLLWFVAILLRNYSVDMSEQLNDFCLTSGSST
jgi:hypothetical protein